MTDLVPCPMPRERTPYARLIEAAAQIARLTNMPDVDQWRWSSSASQRLYRDAKMAEGQAENQCGEWAQAIRIAADKMRAELAHARADIERLSVDLEEARDRSGEDGVTIKALLHLMKCVSLADNIHSAREIASHAMDITNK